MKKNTKNKHTSRKSTKSKSIPTRSTPISASADQDIMGLLSTLVGKLTSFETKIDLVLNRVNSQPPSQSVTAPRQQSITTNLIERRRDRPMYKAICAECRTYCEVPFRPSQDRPIYCRECYRTRKNSGSFRPRNDDKPKEVTSVYVQLPKKPKPAKIVKAAKTVRAVKKKPTVKKKKKTSRKK